MSSGNPNDPRLARLVALVAEAKQDLTPRVPEASWAKMESALVELAKAERAALAEESNVTSLGSRRASRIYQLGAAALAVAAAVAVFVGREPGGALLDGAATAQISPDINVSLRSTEGEGEVRVGGLPVTAGHVLREGDVVEVSGARAILERPRKVTWLVEREASAAPGSVARARVKATGESLVVALEDGAIEAQVTPVPSGEAFAVDVATANSLVRVAVHGTHLRVARTGTHVVVDLTEGVVSIGVPPRTGSTYGTLVTAPSHIEFDAANLDATLTIDHAPTAVRVAVPLAHDPVQPAKTVVRNDPPAAARGAEPATVLTVPRPVRTPEVARAEAPKVVSTNPSPSPREAIARAVRDCAAARQRPENVRVTVTSSLTLKVAASGDVESAQFDPPLLPEIQTCAAAAIYKAKIEDAAGAVTIPIAFTY